MKGIILAGGLGTRLYPITKTCTKQLLPIFDKPMIFYPLTTLMQMGIKDILCICKKNDLLSYKNILNNGSQWGINIKFAIQKKPAGIAESFIIGKNFIGKDDVTLILGDNIFFGIDDNLSKFKDGAKIFAYKVQDPSRYGVVFLKNDLPYKIIEKPKKTKSNLAVTGLYMFDNSVVDIARKIKPSKRKELEITDINNSFINKGKMKASILGPGCMWLDAGTFVSLLQASLYVQTIQERQNMLIGSPELTAFQKKFISKKKIINYLKKQPNNSYFNFLRQNIL